MKKINIILVLLAFITLAPSCQDDGGDSKKDLPYGA